MIKSTADVGPGELFPTLNDLRGQLLQHTLRILAFDQRILDQSQVEEKLYNYRTDIEYFSANSVTLTGKKLLSYAT